MYTNKRESSADCFLPSSLFKGQKCEEFGSHFLTILILALCIFKVLFFFFHSVRQKEYSKCISSTLCMHSLYCQTANGEKGYIYCILHPCARAHTYKVSLWECPSILYLLSWEMGKTHSHGSLTARQLVRMYATFTLKAGLLLCIWPFATLFFSSPLFSN